MDRREIALKLTLNALGLPCQMREFNDRLILQKAIYLAQAAGVNLGYYFGWYLHGPYCSSLAEDGFSIDVQAADSTPESEGWRLDNSSTAELKKIEALFAGKNRKALAKDLELLASVHYLVDRKQVSGEHVAAIQSKLQRYGKEFTDDNVNGALRKLRGHDLLRSDA